LFLEPWACDLSQWSEQSDLHQPYSGIVQILANARHISHKNLLFLEEVLDSLGNV
jgi:hypothetical protein